MPVKKPKEVRGRILGVGADRRLRLKEANYLLQAALSDNPSEHDEENN